MMKFEPLKRGVHAFRFSQRPSLTLPTISDPSFTYHVPRRISQQVFHIRSFSSPTPGQTVEAAHPTTKISRNAITCQKRLLPRTRSTILKFSSQPIPTRLIGLSQLSLDLSSSYGRCSTHNRKFHAPRSLRDTSKEKENRESSNKDREIDTPTSKTKDDGSSHQEHFYERLHIPNFHRPTKEELLAAATGFWSRLRVRFKWMTIKSVRPYNLDEIVGFFSWIALGHVVWLIIGTTTFVSLAILAINSIFAQETLARWIGNYLTQSSGLNVVFESAIVPKWKDGVITFKNVFVSRRPGQDQKSSVTKGSPEAAAIAAAQQATIPPEDQNYTQFDITLGEVNVTLSFSKWWNSKGPLQNVEIKHVRGVVDRTHVYWTGEELDPKTYRHEHNPGDFEIESFKIEDLLITLHQPNNFRPFPISIYNADLPRLRKQWLFYDFLCANNMTGEYDHSLFTIHPRQTHSFTGADLHADGSKSNEPWKKQSRIRLDGLNIDHLNRGVEGPFGWISEGNVDIIADMLIPNDVDDSVMKVVSDFYDQIEAQFLHRKQQFQEMVDSNSRPYVHNIGDYNASLARPESGLAAATYSSATSQRQDIDTGTNSSSQTDNDRRFLVMDLRVHLNDVRASVPIFTHDLSYVNNALIRPIVAYINSRRTFIPINCRVVKRISDFDGSWTLYDSCLMDDLSAETYEAFARDVSDEQARLRRFKKVGLWSLQLAVQAIFLGMAGNIA